MIRVILPHHLRTLAKVGKEVSLGVDGAVTQHSLLDELEAQYPTLRGTMRDHLTKKAGRCCDSSLAGKIGPTSPPTPRSRMRSSLARNPSTSSERLPEGKRNRPPT